MAMNRYFASSAMVLVGIGTFSSIQSQVSAPESGTTKTPIVALVERNHGRLVISIDPDPAPSTDALSSLDLLHHKLGSNYPVMAIVEDTAKISDLWEVSGIASKAGFEKTRTFIHTRNGAMFEVTYGPPIPFSKTGPFDPKASER